MHNIIDSLFHFLHVVCSFHVIAQMSRADRLPKREIALSRTVFAWYDIVCLSCLAGVRYAFSLPPDITVSYDVPMVDYLDIQQDLLFPGDCTRRVL